MAENSPTINIDREVDVSSKTNDVFLDASDITSDGETDNTVKEPNPKKRKGVVSNGSKSDGEVDDEEEEEEGECVDDKKHREVEGCKLETFAELLCDYKAMKLEINQLKAKQSDSVVESIRCIIKDTVKHMFPDMKKQIVSELNIDGINSAMRTYVKKANSNCDKTERIERQLNKISDRGGPIPDERVPDDVMDRVSSVELKVVDLEARSKRNNLVFHGVEESADENCMDLALDLIDRGCHVTKGVTLERVHRIGGRKRGNKSRPLIVKFLDFQDKVLVQRGRKNLPKDISVSDDLPQPIRNARKCLVPQLIEKKKAGMDAYIRYPATLVVNGEVVRTEPIQPFTRTADRHTPNRINNNNNNGRDSYVNTDVDETIPHEPWTRVGNRGKHRQSPEQLDNGRPNNREIRDNLGQRGGFRSVRQDGDRGYQRGSDNRQNSGQWRFGGSENNEAGHQRDSRDHQNRRGRNDYRR